MADQKSLADIEGAVYNEEDRYYQIPANKMHEYVAIKIQNGEHPFTQESLYSPDSLTFEELIQAAANHYNISVEDIEKEFEEISKGVYRINRASCIATETGITQEIVIKGQKMMIHSGGIIEQLSEDGVQVLSDKNGVVTRNFSDGAIITEHPDGRVVYSPNSSETYIISKDDSS